MTDSITRLTAAELSLAYADRRLSPTEVLTAVLDHIDHANPSVNAFALLDPDTAKAAARQSETRWMRQQPLGPLDGVPGAVKDLLLAKGWPTRRGSLAVNPDQAWDEDASVVARLREEGVVLLGKTTTAEYGAKGDTENPLTGVTRNPWNPDKSPGGSSGGAAVAAALGFGPIQIGTDGGGSIRQPASFTGTVGFKPSYGLVPCYPAAFRGSLFHVGPIARSVMDVAMILNAITKPDDRDWYAHPYHQRDWRLGLEDGVRGLRIAFSPDLGYAKVDPEVASIVAAGVALFAELGAMVEIASPGFEDPLPIAQGLTAVGAHRQVKTFSPEQQDRIGPDLRAMWQMGKKIDIDAYLSLTEQRAALGRALNRFHRDWDLLVTPTTPHPAFDSGSAPTSCPFTYPFNLTQQPAISIPVGFTSQGLPVGLQIVGPHLKGDQLVLQAARAFERIRPFKFP